MGRLLGQAWIQSLRRPKKPRIEDAPRRASPLPTALAYGFFLLAGVALVAFAPLEIALGYQIAWRLTSVLYLSVALSRERRREDREGAGARFARFSRIAAFNINNDAIALVVLCLATRGTLPLATDPWVAVAVGAALVALGLGIKFWAARSLGYRNYYCRDFFLPPERPEACRTGPYRFLRNPMYTVGYAHAYGLALVLGSWPGLVAALFDQASMLVFWALVERPHVNRLYRREITATEETR